VTNKLKCLSFALNSKVIMAGLRSRCGHYIFVLWFLSFFFFFMVALWNTADHYIFIMWFLSFYLLRSFFIAWSQRSHIGLPYFDTWCGLSANLECRSETYCARLAENAGPKKSPKIGHLGTIVQLCRAISSQLRHISTIGKKTYKTAIYPTRDPTIWWTSAH